MFSIKLLKEYVSSGLVSERKHPDLDLYIYNYTPYVQYYRLWDEITLACRGLILDSKGKVFARPFGKFFNLEELTQTGVKEVAQIPKDEQFEVYEKLDGSLGIVFFGPDKKFHVATRGSFDSEQAQRAQKMLERYDTRYFVPWYTHLVEIIYPENRVVVDYGEEEKLILLDIIHNERNIAVGPQNLEGKWPHIVKRYDGVEDFSTIRERFSGTNKEGFVIKFERGFRIKVKFEEYVKVHRIRCALSDKNVWAWLSGQEDINFQVENLPDELHQEVKQIQQRIQDRYNEVESTCKADFQRYIEGQKEPGANPTRRYASKFFKSCRYPSILFKMLDGREYSHLVWKTIKPR